MQVGIIGLPNVGKSTIFNTITRAHAAVANYPFCTIEPNTGFISVPDDNITPLSVIFNSRKVTNASIKIVDVAGLVEGASRGEGLGNKFLSHIREVDVIAHVVRCFYDENVSHISKDLDPLRDIGIINTELLLSDIETLNKRREKYLSMLKAKDKEAMENYEIIETLIAGLNKVGGPGNISSNDAEGKQDPDNIEEFYKIKNNHPDLFKELNLFYFKPVIIIANLSEDKKDNEFYNNLVKTMNNNIIIKIYAKLENELQELPEGERQAYRDELGIEKDGIEDFIKTSYRLLNLITFYTANENEAKAWPVSGKTRLIEAAGKIHTDMQKGFIKAEVINCEDLLRIGSINRAREDGRVRLEGKDYIVNDKDVIQIKFSS